MTRTSRVTNRQDCDAFLLGSDTNNYVSCFRQCGLN
jgi:hypothetical protein